MINLPEKYRVASLTPAWCRKRTSGKTRKILLPPVEDDCDLKKLPSGFTPTFIFVGSGRGSGHQLNSTLNLIVAKEFTPVCRRFTHTPTRRQPRRQVHTARRTQRCTPSIQQTARHALFDRRPLRRDNLPTNHSLRTQHEYPQVTYRPLSVISCNLLRLDSFLYHSPVTTAVLGFPLGRPRLRLRRNTAYLPPQLLTRTSLKYNLATCVF